MERSTPTRKGTCRPNARQKPQAPPPTPDPSPTRKQPVVKSRKPGVRGTKTSTRKPSITASSNRPPLHTPPASPSSARIAAAERKILFGGLDAGDSSDEDDGKVFFSGLNAGVKPDEKEGTIASGSPNEGNSSNDNDDIFAGVGPNPGDSAEENGNRNIFSGANAWESSGKAVGGVLLGGPNAGDSSDGEDCDGEVAGVGISYRLPMDSLAGIQLGPKVCSQGSVVRCERGSISDSGVKIFKKGSGKSEESEVEEESKKTGSRITRKIKTGFKGAGKNGSP